MTEENNNAVGNEVGYEVGNVVWFDQRKGFGFIKIITPGSSFLNKDIFVHFSSVQSQNRFKKLYTGENVSLNVEQNTDSNANGKEFFCSDVSPGSGLGASGAMACNIVQVLLSFQQKKLSKKAIA